MLFASVAIALGLATFLDHQLAFAIVAVVYAIAAVVLLTKGRSGDVGMHPSRVAAECFSVEKCGTTFQMVLSTDRRERPGHTLVDVTDADKRGLRERKRESTRMQIEAAAIGLFEAVGFDNATVDDIAEKAVVSRTSIFRYYGSKEDIIFGPEQEVGAKLRDLVRQEPFLRLDEVMVRFAEYVEGSVPDVRQRLDIIVRTPALLGRLADLAAQWSLVVADDIAARRGAERRTLEDLVLATTVMTAYFVPLREWPATATGTRLVDLVRQANEVIAKVYDADEGGDGGLELRA